MQVRAATAQDAAGIVALHKASNPYGDWYRDPIRRLGRVPYEDLTSFERYLHGGFWMDLSLFRRHLHEYQRRGFPVLVAEAAGRILGESEVWLDEEPPPFGRYAEVVRLETGLPPSLDVEQELLRRAAERAGKLGYAALDLCPEHTGRAGAWKQFGFRFLWDTRSFVAEAKAVPEPPEFEVRYLGGEYSEFSGLLPLNHREPARWRYETSTGQWPAAQIAGLADATRIMTVAVDETRGPRFNVVAATQEWLDHDAAELDLWMEPRNRARSTPLKASFLKAVEIGRRLGAKRVRTFAPAIAAKELESIGFISDEVPSTRLRWSL